MSDATNAGIIQVGEERWIPGSQRADGSYRKERKRYTNSRIESPTPSKTKPGIPGAKSKEPVKPVKKATVAATPPSNDQPLEKKSRL
ncbi:unnamed protein product [Mucor hiemalis]